MGWAGWRGIFEASWAEDWAGYGWRPVLAGWVVVPVGAACLAMQWVGQQKSKILFFVRERENGFESFDIDC